jgi:hypothetical protein
MNDLNFIWDNNSKYFLAPYDMLNSEIVQKAKSLWKEVVTYTVNGTWDFQAMKDLWVKMVMSDSVNLLKEYEISLMVDNNPIREKSEWINLRKSAK